MRKAREDELPLLADFFVERFWDLEFFTFLREGMAAPKQTLKNMVLSELGLLYTKGEVYVYDDQFTGALAGISSKAYNLMNQILYSYRTRKAFNALPKQDQAVLLQKSRLLTTIHERKPWYKAHTRHCFYVAQIAVAQSASSTGVFRGMLVPVISQCQDRHMDIALETFTKANVPIYEHFGFKLIEVHSSPDLPFAEYCLFLKTDAPENANKKAQRFAVGR